MNASRLAAGVRVRTERVVRRATADLRALPDFVIIGAQKAGTTSLWRYLVEHPRIVGPTEKEIHFFDARFHRGERWYRARFPLRTTLARGSRMTFEASPYYLAHPFAAARMRTMLPDVKLIVLLRDPVERAWSHYRDNVHRGTESESFMAALTAEPERLEPGRARIAHGLDPGAAFRNYSYVERGKYATQLARWFDAYPRSQFLVIESHRFFTDTEAAYDDVLRFVGLPTPPALPAFDVHNATPGVELDDDARAFLTAAFTESNRELAELIGIDFSGARPPQDVHDAQLPDEVVDDLE